MVNCLAAATVVELARCIRGGDHARRHRGDAEARVMRFLAVLPDRCQRPWTIDTMAAACGLGRTRFAEIVKRHTGDPPIMALNRMRVERARTMLLSSNRPITDIAFACGFNSAQYFARIFHQYTGMSARHYRRQHGQARLDA